MSLHLSQDLNDAHNSLLRLSGNVEEMIGKSVQSLVERRGALAAEVIQKDNDIDRSEVRIEEDCLKMLALHQPVAADLRRITTMMKINNDLERMADLACNIAQRADSLCPHPEFPIPSGIEQMASMANSMVRRSLDAFVNRDTELAYQVIKDDDQVDAKNVEVIETLNAIMSSDASQIYAAMHCFSASRHLEQIADHAVSIAEDTIYMVNGVIVRHRQISTNAATNQQSGSA
ncbi:MAG: phosphate signaling complex protein PhoU [Planctomycetes bacterium]|jgi:phosphate transport system protein|nr:phosphate signaling complex protein PhoU [Planctomycetota bacterium]